MRALAVLGLTSVLLLNAERLPPVDESTTDPEFLAFKVKLLGMLQRRELRSVQALAEPEARSELTPASLPELERVIRLGVARDEGDFIAPYVFVRMPKDVDAYTHAAAIRPAVKVHKLPVATAAVVDTLNYDVVELQRPAEHGWVEVRTPSDKTGWVLRHELQSPLDYRAFFEKKDGQWRLTSFVRGD